MREQARQMDEIVIEVGKRHIRDVNREIMAACARGRPIRVVDTLSRHNLGGIRE